MDGVEEVASEVEAEGGARHHGGDIAGWVRSASRLLGSVQATEARWRRGHGQGEHGDGATIPSRGG